MRATTWAVAGGSGAGSSTRPAERRTRAARLDLASSMLALVSASFAAQGLSGPPQIETVGLGTRGSHGVPLLDFAGSPVVGRPLSFGVSAARKSTIGLLATGPAGQGLPLPRFGATLYPAFPLHVTGFAVDDEGRSGAILELSEVGAHLLGVELVVQAAIVDPAAQGGAAFTRGRWLRIGEPTDNLPLPLPLYSVGRVPSAMAAGDLNHDGLLDLAIANRLSNDVSLLFNRGDASFDPGAPIALTYGPSSVAIADVDLDSHQDLVTAPPVLVHLGRGDGTFDLATAVSVPGDVVSVADVDRDGMPDLLVGGTYSPGLGRVQILRGLGSGTFSTAISHSVGDRPRRVLAVDLNGDGWIDVVTPNGNSGDASILLATGGGEFEEELRYVSGPSPRDVAAGDLDGDGDLDLVVTNEFDAYASLLLGDGRGGFAPPLHLSTLGHASYVEVADVDRDGLQDIVLGASGVEVQPGVGGGSFGPPRRFSGGYPLAFVVADFDLDGRLDAASSFLTDASGPIPYYSACIQLGEEGGGFLSLGEVPLPNTHGAYPTYWTTGLAPADLDGNGITDLLLSRYDENYEVNELLVLPGLGDGTFAAAQVYDVEMTGVQVADLNDDGMEDAVGFGGHFASVRVANVMLGAGGGTLGTPRSFPTGQGIRPRDVAIDDFDLDGTADLAISSASSAGPGAVTLLVGAGDGTFAPAGNYAAGHSGWDLASGDLNGDGLPDLAVADSGYASAEVIVLFNLGGRSFAEQTLSVGATPQGLELGDLDGDGLLDLVVSCFPDEVRTFRNSGGATFAESSTVTVGSYGEVSVTDLDGDVVLDVLVGGEFLMRGRGDGTYLPVEHYLSHGTRLHVTGDFDGKGLQDVAFVRDEVISQSLFVSPNVLLRP